MTSKWTGLSRIRSTASRMTPPTISTTQISAGVSKSTVLMKSCATAPMTAAGRKPIRIETTNQRERAEEGRVSAMSISLRA